MEREKEKKNGTDPYLERLLNFRSKNRQTNEPRFDYEDFKPSYVHKNLFANDLRDKRERIFH